MKWKPKDKPKNVCPKCFEVCMHGTRWPYCGPGDVNYVTYTCKNCGHTWQVTD